MFITIDDISAFNIQRLAKKLCKPKQSIFETAVMFGRTRKEIGEVKS